MPEEIFEVTLFRYFFEHWRTKRFALRVEASIFLLPAPRGRSEF